MGSLFRYVADSALRGESGPKCHQCESDEKPVFPYWGRILEPRYAANPTLALEEPEVDELCADCILGGNVERIRTERAQVTVDRFAADKKAAWAAFNQLPGIPLFLQGFDWPMCCGDWCEFVGSPHDIQSLLSTQAAAQFWDRGPSQGFRNFEQDGPPESFDEISSFICHTCGKAYYTDQFT